ncbi:hypothetical protein BDW68DRAFT_178185 [Aspergillus falconensis]
MATISSFSSTGGEVDVGNFKAKSSSSRNWILLPLRSLQWPTTLYDFKYTHTLPISDYLGTRIPSKWRCPEGGRKHRGCTLCGHGDGDATAFANMFWEYVSGVINSVLTKDGWKIYTMHTVAEKLKQYPELPPADGHMTGPIVIIGGGQNDLALAAGCKALGMDTLIIECNESVGDVWKKRYEYLSLHFSH